jgi:hypothetical protein
MFTDETYPSVAFAACNIGWILGIQFLTWWNELAAGRIRTEYPRLPGRAVLDDSLQEFLLNIAAKQVPYQRAG